MKYVAFLDILGFKEKIKNLSQEKATDFIARFSSTIYSKFENESNQIMGYIVSDSVILYTQNNSQESLMRLVNVIIDICHAEFAENGIIIRGAIAKGSFNRIPATELKNLQKGLIVGQAYVEAYTLEGSIKNIGITLSKSVFQDLENIDNKYKIIEERNDGELFYILRYITIDFLLDQNNLQKFVFLAKEAEWLPHYYNTIYFALKNESNDNKVEQLFDNILSLVCDDKPKENWRDLDIFIKNGFASNVMDAYKTRLLKFIRSHLFNW